MHVSQFTPFAIGTAAENKALKSKQLLITPHEAFPFLDGELAPNPTQMDFHAVDADGQNSQGMIFTDTVLEATWLPEASNRVTAPDVRRGERIVVYRYGDADKYYWRPLGLDDHLRKLETVVFAISGNPKEGNEVLDPSTCYFLEISSHTKKVTFSTSKANGEVVSYMSEFNMATGEFTVHDDLKNEFYLNSLQAYLKMVNTHNSIFELNKRKVRIEGDEEVVVKSGGSILKVTPGQTTLKTPRFRGSK